MSQTKIKRGLGRPKGSKNKVKTNIVKRGRGRPKGSKNKNTANLTSVKRGRGRPKGSKNKVVQSVDEEFYDLPFKSPSNEEQRIANIAHMVSFYQTPEGNPKMSVKPKKRGRKPKLDLMDDDSLVKGDLDSDHFVYTDKDIQEELSRMDGFVDMSKNRSRYSESF